MGQPASKLGPRQDYLLVDIDGNLIAGASMTPSEAKNRNQELATGGALMEWTQYERDDLGDLTAYDVPSRAETMFQIEIKPVFEERLSEPAQALREKDVTLSEVAWKVGFPKTK
jgi:hypothetical protein